jgi:probable HAF family extracellular repeat protein
LGVNSQVSARICASVAILCAGLGALFLFSVAKAQPNYLVPLPQKGGVLALNNGGQVLYDTGLLTGNSFAAFPAGFSAPAGSPGILGESGVVAGSTTTGHLATYSAGTVTDLGPPPWPVQNLNPTAINASGEIAGYLDGPAGQHSFIYSSGVFNSINITGDIQPPEPNDVNDSGQVVLCGPSRTAGAQGDLITAAVVTDLGATCPFAINASGQITGTTAHIAGQNDQHAFIWANGKQTVLAEPPPFTDSIGEEINKGGQIVGVMSHAQSSAPFFYNGVMTDINSLVSAADPLKSSVTIGSVVDINDSRLLLLVSTLPPVGSSTAYLLQAPWLDVAPGPLTFANQGVGTTSQPQTLTLTNSGTAPLPLDSISMAANATGFSQTNACPASLAAAANCTVSVTFAPSVAGVQSAVLNVVTDGATITVSLAGTAPITISLSASPVSPTAGQPFTITWTATAGSTCQSSGGTANDGWHATTASGSVTVTEAAAGTDTYTMTCTAGAVSATQSLEVTVANPPPPPSGGKGALDLWALLFLGCLLVINLWRGWDSNPRPAGLCP